MVVCAQRLLTCPTFNIQSSKQFGFVRGILSDAYREFSSLSESGISPAFTSENILVIL